MGVLNDTIECAVNDGQAIAVRGGLSGELDPAVVREDDVRASSSRSARACERVLLFLLAAGVVIVRPGTPVIPAMSAS